MIRTIAIAALSLAACVGPSTLQRTEVPPPVPVSRELPPNPPGDTDDAATQQWLEGETERLHGVGEQRMPPAAQGGAGRETNEEATKAWLDQTIEERRVANPDQPPEPLYQVIENTVYVDRPVRYRRSHDHGRYGDFGYSGSGYDHWGEPVYAPRYYGSYRHRSTFPVNTAIGAGLGAIIGHQSGRRDRGAAVGAGIGLLFDLAR